MGKKKKETREKSWMMIFEFISELRKNKIGSWRAEDILLGLRELVRQL